MSADTRQYPPAVLGELTEARYRVHVTERAARLGVSERDLSAHLEWRQIIDDIRQETA